MQPPETIDDAILAMDRMVDRALENNDPRGYFTCVYRAVTVRIRDGIAAGEFDDNERMERFDVLFARLYLDAATAHLDGGPGPVHASWRVAFDAPTRWTVALQHLLVGMNAHINVDLGVAAARTQQGGDVAALRDDFERLNDVLAAMVDRMQDAVGRVSPWSGLVDRAAGQFDEMIACWTIERARHGAWELAERLAAAPDDEDRLIADRDRKVAAIGTRILRPSLPTRLAVAAASLRESGDVRSVADALRHEVS